MLSPSCERNSHECCKIAERLQTENKVLNRIAKNLAVYGVVRHPPWDMKYVIDDLQSLSSEDKLILACDIEAVFDTIDEEVAKAKEE